MSELAALQRLSTPLPPSFLTPPSGPPTRSNNSPTKHFDQFNGSPLLPRMPALTLRKSPSLFEMQTMGYGFRGAHIGCPHGVTPRLDPSKGAIDLLDARSPGYRVEVPPCPSPRIQSQDYSMPINSGTAPRSTSTSMHHKSSPQIDDQVQVSYHYYSSELLRLLTFCYYDRSMVQLSAERSFPTSLSSPLKARNFSTSLSIKSTSLTIIQEKKRKQHVNYL